MRVCGCSMFCCTLLYVHFSIAIILVGKRELIALLNWSSWCLVMVERLFLAVLRGCLQFVIVVFPDHTHLPFLGWARDTNPSRSSFFITTYQISIHWSCCFRQEDFICVPNYKSKHKTQNMCHQPGQFFSRDII